MPAHRKQLSFKDKDLWYFVGLIATDGNLSPDGRHIDITTKDRCFLEELRQSLGLENKIGVKSNGSRTGEYYHIQIANKNLYEFLLSVGLTPRKSLTLGELKISNQWLPDFIRGVIDGDGSLRKWIHPSNGKEQWSLSIYSASLPFMFWLQKTIAENFFVKGQIHDNKSTWVLKYGKLAAKRILERCYYAGALGLARKVMLAELCGAAHSGWSRSKTVLCHS